MSKYVDIASLVSDNSQETNFFSSPSKNEMKRVEIKPVEIKAVDKSGTKRKIKEKKKTLKDYASEPLTMKMIIEELPPKAVVVQYFKNLIEKYQDDSDDSEDDMEE
jgi:hypothetical protein